jgi:biopolymer transport protein TolR
MGMGPTRRGSLMAEINVTPLVDVMLVLLIIFMVTAPLMQEQIPVQLPKAKAGPGEQSNESVMLTIKKDGALYLGKKNVTLVELGDQLKKIFSVRDDKTIYLYADQGVPYGTVVQAMSVMQPLGLRLGIMTEPPSKVGR